MLYQNRVKIAEVFRSRSIIDIFAIGFGIYLVGPDDHLRPMAHSWSGRRGWIFSFRDAVRLGFIGNIFNLVIPGAVGGDVIKAAFLCRMQPDKKPQAVASMVLDRILGLLGPVPAGGRSRGPSPGDGRFRRSGS